MADEATMEALREKVRSEVPDEYREETKWAEQAKGLSNELKSVCLREEVAKRMLQENELAEWKAGRFEVELLEEVESWRNGLGAKDYEFTLKLAQEEVQKARMAREASVFLLQEVLLKREEVRCRAEEVLREYNDARVRRIEKMTEQSPVIIAETEKEEKIQEDQVGGAALTEEVEDMAELKPEGITEDPTGVSEGLAERELDRCEETGNSEEKAKRKLEMVMGAE